MSKWSGCSRERIDRALVVQEFGDNDLDALDYLRQTSRADDGRDPAAD